MSLTDTKTGVTKGRYKGPTTNNLKWTHFFAVLLKIS